MLLYIPKDLDYKAIEEPNNFEDVQLYELPLDEGNVVIPSINRSPSSWSANDEKLSSFSRKIGCSRTRYIVFGEINNRDIDWQSSIEGNEEDSKEHKYLEAVKFFYSNQHVEKPTFGAKRNGPSFLDLLLSYISLEPAKIDCTHLVGHEDYAFLTSNVQ